MGGTTQQAGRIKAGGRGQSRPTPSDRELAERGNSLHESAMAESYFPEKPSAIRLASRLERKRAGCDDPASGRGILGGRRRQPDELGRADNWNVPVNVERQKVLPVAGHDVGDIGRDRAFQHFVVVRVR